MGQTAEPALPSLLIAGIIGMFLLALAIIVFFIVYQRRLLRQQEEMNRRDAAYQKELLLATIQSQEAERKRIASDLHDSVGVTLSTTKIYLKQITPEKKKEYISELKKESIELIDETIQNIRHISHALLPPVLERFGFVAAVEDIAEKINGMENLQMDFSTNDNSRFPSDKEINLYRVVQELVNNTIKHSQANKISLILNFEKNKLSLFYSDNGVGISFEKDKKPQKTKGLGMKNLESRLNAINATFNLDTKAQQGFSLHAQVPLP